MSYTRTVWVLDIYEYLEVIETYLNRLSRLYPWLNDRSPIDRSWTWWQRNPDERKTQRDLLIDWIIEKELDDVFYLCSNYPRVPEFEQVHNSIMADVDLNRLTSRLIIIPKIYCEIHVVSIRRHAFWLYIEADIANPTKPEYVLQPTNGFDKKRRR